MTIFVPPDLGGTDERRCSKEGKRTTTSKSKGSTAMSSVISTIKQSRIQNRNRRAMQRMIDGASSPSMRDELIIISQRANLGINR
jgi:hypothetical protein